MIQHVYTARNWAEARKILSGLSPELPISFGTGNPISRPYVQAVYLDADAGEGHGYRVAIKRFGDGYGNPADYYLIYVANGACLTAHKEPYPAYPLKEMSALVVSESVAHYRASTKCGAKLVVINTPINLPGSLSDRLPVAV